MIFGWEPNGNEAGVFLGGEGTTVQLKQTRSATRESDFRINPTLFINY